MPEVWTWLSPVLTFFGGYATNFVSEWIKDRRTTKRERETRKELRRDQRFERRNAFQRQTLLDLQEAALQLAQNAGATHSHDLEGFRATGKWGRQLVPENLNEAFRNNRAKTSMLGSRVRDDATRHLSAELRKSTTNVIFSTSVVDSEREIKNLTAILEALNQRIGEVLRQLDDDEI